MNPSHEKAAFESAIDANPLDASNHLVYADWLDEKANDTGDQGLRDEAAFRRAMGEWAGSMWGQSVLGSQADHWRKNGRAHPYVINSQLWERAANGNDAPSLPRVAKFYYIPYRKDVNPHDEEAIRNMTPDNRGVLTKGYNHELSWPSYRHMEAALREAYGIARPQQMSRFKARRYMRARA